MESSKKIVHHAVIRCMTYIQIPCVVIFMDVLHAKKNSCVLENLRPVSQGSDARLCEPHRPSERTKQNESATVVSGGGWGS